MIFVETSAIVAIMLAEPSAATLIGAIERSDQCLTGSHVRLEVCMVLSSRQKMTAADVNKDLDRFFQRMKVTVLPFTDDIAEAAILAFDKYGKGRNSKTSLNLADCMSYAFAKCHHLKILFTGTDFKNTDLKAA
jgi:ribonuclease VapC